MKNRKSFRKLVIENQTYQYKIGRQHVIIYDYKDKRFDTDLSIISGLSWNDIERLRYKRSKKPFCTPKHVSQWIRKNILGEEEKYAGYEKGIK